MKAPANDGGSAFPVTEQFDERRGEYVKYAEDGMTLRDYFAAKALPEFISLVPTEIWNQGQGLEGKNDNALMAAKAAYRMADAMIAARSKT